jgi:ribosomal protein S18 acetylase RimI-like enzyme
MDIDKRKLSLVENRPEYYEFIRTLRIDPAIITGFVSQQNITAEQQASYMRVHEQDYYICLYESEPVGFIGVVEQDLRLAVRKDFQRNGIATFMLKEMFSRKKMFKVKVKKDNEASLGFFKRNGFKPTGTEESGCVVMERRI